MLGELEVVDDDVTLPIRGARQRALLLLLLIRARETVQAERLVDELWGDAPSVSGPNALQALVSKLRRNLGVGGGLLVTAEGGYRIEVADEAIDARVFIAMAARGRAALDQGEHDVAARELRDALSLWRGPALNGSDDAEPLRREALRLDELRWEALEDRLDADLRCGASGGLVAELEQAVGEAPLRERLHGFLMLGLYRAGRQAEALRAFHEARRVLGDELGLDPGPELQALEAAILSHDPVLDLPVGRKRDSTTRRANLRSPLSTFIGREADRDALQQLVTEHRLTTVVGPGGAGKTRLAHEVGSLRRADEDVWMVELASVSDPVAVADAVATGMAVPDRPRSSTTGTAGSSDAPVLDRIVEYVGDRPTLVLLDNCEHVIDAAARVAEDLLQACPTLRVLATSRESLGIGGETLWPIPPMSPQDASALFIDRAGAAGGLDPDAGADLTILDLCRRLDGLPLAVELAAARTRAIPVPQLASRLDDRFRLLTGGARTAMPRHQTLRAVVEWSYDLLFTDEQEVFDRLSVFAGGCSLGAAEAVCSGERVDPGDVADIVARLVDKSLVIADHSGGDVRYHLLQTLALYGSERLVATGGAADARSRHAAHYGEICGRGPAAFRGADQAAWLAEARRENHNIRAALAWHCERGEAEEAVAMAGGLAWIFWLTGGGDEGVRLLETALACPGTATVAARAFATMWTSAVMSNAGTGLDHAIELGEQALDLWQQVGDEQGRAEACALVGGVYAMRGDWERAIELFDESHALLDGYPDHWSQAVAASSAGRAAAFRGDLEAAGPLQHRCVAEFEAAGATWAVASVNSDIAQLADMRGDVESAVTGQRRKHSRPRGCSSLGLAEAHLLARLGNLALARATRTTGPWLSTTRRWPSRTRSAPP